MKTILPLFFALACALLEPRTANACDCGGQDLRQAFTNADTVALVSLIRTVTHRPSSTRSFPITEYIVRIDRSWKGGRAGETISIWDAGSSCDILHAPWSGSLLIFARRNEAARLIPGHCDQPWFSRRMTQQEIVAQLDAM